MNFFVTRDYNGQLWAHTSKPKLEGWCWQSRGKMVQVLKGQEKYKKLEWQNNPMSVAVPAETVEKLVAERQQLIDEAWKQRGDETGNKHLSLPPCPQLPCTVGEYNEWFNLVHPLVRKVRELDKNIVAELEKIWKD